MKTEQFHLRLSSKELDALDVKAKELGITKSDLIRGYILKDVSIPVSLVSALKDLAVATNRIGVNINQIAKKANESGVNKMDIANIIVYQRDLLKKYEEVVNNCYNQNTSYERSKR